MIITAFIKPGTTIHNQCRRMNRRNWAVDGVKFNYILASGKYVSGLLTEAEYERLRVNPVVQVEVVSAPSAAVVEALQAPPLEEAPKPSFKNKRR